MRPRLVAVVCVLMIFRTAHARAQVASEPSAFIEWSADRSLAIKDFKGRIPARAHEASRSWVAIEASWECQGGTGSWRARAVFDPSRSWWREVSQHIWQGSDDPLLLAPKDDGGRGLLAHEQLHFDLTELWARKIRAVLTTLPVACKTPGASYAFEGTIGTMERDWLDEQKRYDRETGNGMDAGRQRAWAARTEKALEEGYSAPRGAGR